MRLPVGLLHICSSVVKDGLLRILLGFGAPKPAVLFWKLAVCDIAHIAREAGILTVKEGELLAEYRIVVC